MSKLQSKNILKIDVLLDAILLVTALSGLGTARSALLLHFSEYTYFSSEPAFVCTFLDNPGEILDYLGAFFTRLCACPMAGASCLGVLLVLLRRLLARAVGGEAARWLSFFPPVLLLLFLLRMDYGVYVLKSYGFVFSPVLGLLGTAGVYALYRFLFPKRGWCWLLVPLTVLLFPLLGFYLLAGALMAALPAVSRNGRVSCAVMAVLVLLPLFCAYSDWVYPRINMRFAFLGGLPYRDLVGEAALFLPLGAAVCITVLLPVSGKVSLPRPAWIAAAVLALACLFAFPNRDRNFQAVLRMEAALSRSDWDGILAEAQKIGEPSRIHVVYRNIALYQKDQLCDRMFTFPDGSAPLKTSAVMPISFLIAPEALLRAGLLNYAERWATELSATYTKNVHYLKCLARVAVLTGDRELARKYFALLRRCPFTGSWVRRHETLLADPAALSADPEMRRILDLYQPDERRIIAGEAIEGVILDHFASMPVSNGRQYECRMASLLTLKQEGPFMKAFLDHSQAYPGERIPAGIAQAAVLFGGTSGDRDLYLQVFDQFRDETVLLRDFGSYGRDYNNAGNISSPSMVQRFAQKYGKTYWFYYHFVNDLKTN